MDALGDVFRENRQLGGKIDSIAFERARIVHNEPPFLMMTADKSVCGRGRRKTAASGGQLCSKALDDRLGCYQLIESLKENPGDLPNDIYYCFVVQEELGNRGAQVAAQQILPDIGIAVDITPAHDYPNDLTGANRVGAGIGVKICDPSVVADETVVAVMEKLCTEKGIPYQRDVIDRGGTDASAMNVAGAGAKTGGISVVTRYPHSQSSVVDSGDVEAGIDLMNAFSAYNFSLA